MNIDKLEWENPDDPSDCGWVWVCIVCGNHGQLEHKDCALTHKCSAEALAENAKWEKCYEDWPTDEEMEACYKETGI
jgi:hypothetical protein